MRVKMSSATAPANTMNTMTPFWANKALRRSLHTFVKGANDAAIALYTVYQLCSAPYDLFGTAGLQRDIAHRFLRIAGVLSSVLSSCDLDALPDEVKSHLNAHVESCQPLLQKVDEAVERLHAHYILSDRRDKKVAPSFAAFGRDVDRDVVRSLDDFFDFALSVRLCADMREAASCGDSNTGTVGLPQKVPFASLGCLLEKADKSLLRQRSALFETLYPAPKRQNPFSQDQREAQQSEQSSTTPQVTCSIFANKAAQDERSSATSLPIQIRGLGQQNAGQSLFAHSSASAEWSENKPATDSTAPKHPFAVFCERGPTIPSQPQIWGQSVGGADSESQLVPPTPVQKHYFPNAGSYPEPQAQPLPFPQPKSQPPNISSCHPPTTTTTTANMSDDKPSLFRADTTPAKSAFGGNSSGGGLFGGKPSTGSLFGGAGSTGGFGGTASTGGFEGNSSTGGLFGGGNTSTGGLFGGGHSTAGGLFGAATSSTGGLFGGIKPSNSLFGPKPAATTLDLFDHFEAYILRPHADSANDFTTWSYKVDTLLLDNTAMQAHNTKLGPTYSVVDAIGLLQPQQLHLVQEHVKAREGKLVSVQFGVASDMPTPMGTSMRVQSVIFLLKTAKPAEGQQQPQGFSQVGKQHSCWMPSSAAAAQPTSLFGNAANTTNSNTGLFGGFGSQSNAHQNSNNTTTTGLFGSANDPPKPSPFGPNNGNTHSNRFVSTVFPAKGDEHCTFKDPDGTTGTSMQHYMTLPAYFEDGKSFEEARNVDYANGFTQETTVPQTGAVCGTTAVQNQAAPPAASAQPAPTPHFGGWGQKAAIAEGLSIFPRPGAANTPFANLLGEAKGSSLSPFASTTDSNQPPNPFAASTTPTKPPPNPFAKMALSPFAAAAGFNDGSSSSLVVGTPGHAAKASAGPFSMLSSTKADAKPASSSSVSKIAAEALGAPTSTSVPATHGQLVVGGAQPGDPHAAAESTSSVAAPDAEMSKLFIEAQEAREEGSIHEGGGAQNVEQEKDGGEQVEEKPQDDDKKAIEGPGKEDAEYDDCGDVVGKGEREK